MSWDPMPQQQAWRQRAREPGLLRAGPRVEWQGLACVREWGTGVFRCKPPSRVCLARLGCAQGAKGRKGTGRGAWGSWRQAAWLGVSCFSPASDAGLLVTEDRHMSEDGEHRKAETVLQGDSYRWDGHVAHGLPSDGTLPPLPLGAPEKGGFWRHRAEGVARGDPSAPKRLEEGSLSASSCISALKTL